MLEVEFLCFNRSMDYRINKNCLERTQIELNDAGKHI